MKRFSLILRVDLGNLTPVRCRTRFEIRVRQTPAKTARPKTLIVAVNALLPREKGVPHKTGTLRDVRSMVGYLDSDAFGTVRFVIWMDGSGHQRRWRVVDALESAF